jgi:peptidoglycan/LPS O-acetylase OafA/YrhL
VPPPTAPPAGAQAPAAPPAARRARGEGLSGGLLLGGLLVVLGLFFLVRQYLPSIDFDWFWPVVLVGLGVVLLLSAVGRGPRSGDQG